MKTKYIFRLLFMAVALVMGSQVRATESEPIYQGAGSGQVNVGGNDVFTDPSGIIRVYVESPAWTLQLKGSWNIPVVLQNGDNDGFIDNSEFNNAGGYIDAKLTASAVDVIMQQGLVIWTDNKIVTRVTYVLNGVESEPVFLGSGTGQVNVDGKDVFTNPSGVIRIYAESPSWTLKFAGSWTTPIVLQNGDSNGFINTNDYNVEGGYIDAILTASAVDVIKEQGLVLWPSNIIVTKVIYVTGGTTPAAPTHTLTINIDGQAETKTVAEGTVLANVLPTPMKEGYSFKGWIGMPEDGKMPTSDLTVTAKFAIVYKVEIAATPYGIITTDKEAYEEGETVIVTIAANTGYEMESISTNPKSSTGIRKIGDGVFSFIMPASDVKVTVRYNAKQYTLTFMLNGEVYVVNDNVRYGDDIVLPQDPEVEEGFSFPGWIDVPETMPADNFTIYGHYIATLSVGESGYATYCPMKPIIFQGNENVKAFIAKEKSATEVILKQVRGAVAVGTGLVLKGEPGAEAEFEVTNEGTDYSGTNLMVGVTETNATINAANLYVLVQKTDGVKFADTEANAAVVPIGKAYLQAPANSSRLLTISFDDETTAMKGVGVAETDKPTIVYNLSGQRVTSPKAGLYIMNGKKVVIK